MTEGPFNNIGVKIRYFRKRAGLSQMDLELDIESSSGSLSRIENGEINPTKETILKIAKVLKLSNYEIQYLIGPLALEATTEEIQKVKNEVEAHLKKRNVLAYIVDDRSRLIDISDDFLRLGNLDPETYKKNLLGEYLPKIIVDKSFGIRTLFDVDKVEEIIYYSFARTYDELNFMDDDVHLKNVLQIVNSDPIAKAAWKEFSTKKSTLIQSDESRTVTFKIRGITVPLRYSVETLWSNPKFRIFEYTPTSIVHKLLMRFA